MKGAAAAGKEARATMSLRPSERAEVRRSHYKVALDVEDGRRQHEDNMVEIRKSRREESLLKKRCDDLPPSVTVATPQMAHSSALQQKPRIWEQFPFGLEDSPLSHEREGLRLQGAQRQAQEGDNIYGVDATDATKSMDATIVPAIAMKLLWAAVIGNHDQVGTLSREGAMHHLVEMKNTLS